MLTLKFNNETKNLQLCMQEAFPSSIVSCSFSASKESKQIARAF